MPVAQCLGSLPEELVSDVQTGRDLRTLGICGKYERIKDIPMRERTVDVDFCALGDRVVISHMI